MPGEQFYQLVDGDRNSNNIMIILGIGFTEWDQDTKVGGMYHKVSFILSQFDKRSNWAVK